MARDDTEKAFVSALVAHQFAPNKIRQDEPRHEYYQISLLSALMGGVYEGKTRVGDLLTHGDFGLGTYNALDGEMAVLDGVAYRMTGDGTAVVAAADALTPYAAVINFTADIEGNLDGPLARPAFESKLDQVADSRNLFYAIRVDGVFSGMKIRNVVRQEPPFKPLVEAVSEQEVHRLEIAEGTMLGFRCPDYAVGISVPGYHMHFLSADRSTGGHVMDYVVESARLTLDQTSSIHLELPDSKKFNEADLQAGASASDIQKVEN